MPIQDLNVLTNLIISATALVKLNDSLAAFNTAYTGSGSTSSSSSSCYTSLHIDKDKMGITSANIEAVKALLTDIVGDYTAGGRSALGEFTLSGVQARQGRAAAGVVAARALTHSYTLHTHAHTPLTPRAPP